MNLFFGTKLDGRDIELTIGRYPIKTVALNGKTAVIKAWNNPLCRFERLVSGLEKAIRQSDSIPEKASDWMTIASRIAVLFGVFGLLYREQRHCRIDISLPSGDMSALMAAWYAKRMGLPIGTIICCCNENNSLWNFFHKGEIRTDLVAVRTHTPSCDYTVPTDLERLIFEIGGHEEVLRFNEVSCKGGTYTVSEDLLAPVAETLHICVVSGKRMASTIPNLYKTTGFIADPYTALAYSGLTDYRAVTGSGHQALIISEESPLFSLDFISQCMNLTPSELKIRLE